MFRLQFDQFEYPVGAVLDAVAAVDANHRFIGFIIPENSPDGAGVLAVATADAFSQVNPYPLPLFGFKGTRRAYLDTGWVLAGTADDNDKALLHSTG
jgi:hypothetical protein